MEESKVVYTIMERGGNTLKIRFIRTFSTLRGALTWLLDGPSNYYSVRMADNTWEKIGKALIRTCALYVSVQDGTESICNDRNSHITPAKLYKMLHIGKARKQRLDLQYPGSLIPLDALFQWFDDPSTEEIDDEEWF